MTSRDALRTILINCKDLLVDENYSIVYLEDLITTINQDLDRLEKIEKWVNDKLDYLNNGVFLVSGDYLKGAIKILLELKEVLNNEIK